LLSIDLPIHFIEALTVVKNGFASYKLVYVNTTQNGIN